MTHGVRVVFFGAALLFMPTLSAGGQLSEEESGRAPFAADTIVRVGLDNDDGPRKVTLEEEVYPNDYSDVLDALGIRGDKMQQALWQLRQKLAKLEEFYDEE